MAIAALQDALRVGEDTSKPQLLLLSQAYFRAGRYGDLITLWAQQDPQGLAASDRSVALGLLGRAYEALEHWHEAISCYQRYLELDDAAAPHVRVRIAYAYEELGEAERAAQQLGAIDLRSVDRSARADILEDLAGLQEELGDLDRALESYDEILSFAQAAYYRGAILWRKGQLLLAMGRQDKAAAVFRQAMDDYPQTWGAYASLLALDDMEGQQVSLLQRGQVLYHAGQYAQSIKALTQYRQANPYGFHSTAHLYEGLAYHALGEFEEAIDEFDVVIHDYAWTEVVGDAWMAKARSLTAVGADASGTYQEFAARYSIHVRAPEALWSAALVLERREDWEAAGELHLVLRSRYPNDFRSEEAAFHAGLAAYAVGDWTRAVRLWQQSLVTMEPDDDGYPDAHSRALTWTGLALVRAGEPESAQHYWQQAVDAAPANYYGLRARDLMQGHALLMPEGNSAPAPESRLNDDDWRLIGEWVEGWAQEDEDREEPTEVGLLVSRATALWDLGWHDEAMAVYRQHRDQILDQPRELVALARHCCDTEVWPMVISCAERLISLGRSAGAEQPPKALWRAAYPTPYAHLIAQEAALHDLDPLLFLALIRQESLFNPNVHSWAGAIGLAQVMPETGAWIAGRLGEESYQDSLLLRPVVALRYGGWYLGQALALFERSWPAAVASYNAGWANVRNWLTGDAAQDPDWFYEVIPLAEPKTFVRLVYENLRAYERIYRE